MAEAVAYTKVGVDDIVASLVNGGHIDGSGNLILELQGGGTINVGPVDGSAPANCYTRGQSYAMSLRF